MTTRFTDELRALCIDEWNSVINHKFTAELAKGTISQNVLRKYLIQDHRFLDSFVVLLSSMVAKARCLEDRIPGCQFLALITGDENDYFQRSFDSLGCVDTERCQIPNENVTTDFIKLMKDASEGTLGEMLSVLVVCEWSYLSWGERVLPITKREADGATFLTYEWVDLHSGDYFASVISYLRGLLDKEKDLIDDDGREKCRIAFHRAVRLEQDFFDMAYT